MCFVHCADGGFLSCCLRIIQDLGGKERVMELLVTGDVNVRKYALLCMQKMLVQKHQFLIK